MSVMMRRRPEEFERAQHVLHPTPLTEFLGRHHLLGERRRCQGNGDGVRNLYSVYGLRVLVIRSLIRHSNLGFRIWPSAAVRSAQVQVLSPFNSPNPPS